MKDLYAKKGQIVYQMRAMLDAADAAGRGLTADESAMYARMESDLENVTAEVKRREALEGYEKERDEILGTVQRAKPEGEGSAKPQAPRATADYVEAFKAYARAGKSNLGHEFLAALQIGTNSEGGYLVPEEFETQLVVALQRFNFMRQVGTVIRTNSDRNIPVETSSGSATWMAEEAAYTESDAAFGRVVLGAHKLGRIIRVSEELVEDAFFDLEAYIADNYGRTFGVAEETAFLVGTGAGSNQPAGVFPAAQVGVTAVGTAAVTADEIIDLYHSLRRPYRANAVFVANDLNIRAVRKLKDSNGQYLWSPGLGVGAPETLLGRPLYGSEATPVMATGARSFAFGDMSYYTIADRGAVAMQRLNELYAANGQIGFRMRKRTEGQLTLAEAVKVLVQA